MRCFVSLIGVISAAHSLVAREKKPGHVDRLCGRAQYGKQIPDRKHPNTCSDKRKDVMGIRVELHESNEGRSCCNGLRAFGATLSGRSGEFEFKPDNAGHYWLGADWNGRDCRLAVIYERRKRSSTVCSGQGTEEQNRINAQEN